MIDDDGVWRRWDPKTQERALAALRDVAENTWRPFYCHRPLCDGKPHDRWDWPHARHDQHPPKGDWLTWLIRGGRGSGKTRSGAEWTHRRTKVSPRIALVAPTGPDARDILVEGESGILACAPPGKRPLWEPSKRKLTWPNGAIAHTYSAEEPDRLRGPQHNDAWLDEPAHMPLIDEVWSNLLFGMRLGPSRICCTTTPKPSDWITDLINDPSTVSVVVATYANLHNLPDHYVKIILERYEGTRLGRQEIHGEILGDVEGALWDWDLIQRAHLDPADAPAAYDRAVVAVDPAGTANNRSDETGVIVVAAAGGDFYVLADRSGRYKPNVWAHRVIDGYDDFDADLVVAEDNYGGEMVESTIEAACDAGVIRPRIKRVNSRRGKIIRADPIVALYERGKVHHVGAFPQLEDQLTSWVPGTDSPDRLDALVHGITELARVVAPSAVADPTRLRLNRPHLRVVS